MHDIRMCLAFCFALFATVASAENLVTSVTARQIQPWNGLVEITVGLSCESSDLAGVFCTFAAKNSTTQEALPVSHVRHVGRDTGSGVEWQRHFIWDAAADLGAVKIDDVALTVEAEGPVQLWEGGPYWAPCNVGATKPEECGYYFWWGDTIGYERNSNNDGWVSVATGEPFLFSSINCPTQGKSNSQLQSEGYIDSTGNLVAAHDAATAYFGAPWRMPTHAEFTALINNCTTTWTTRNGVLGRIVTGKGAYATKSVFLPANGFVNGSNSLQCLGSNGEYWSSTPLSGYSHLAWHLTHYSGGFFTTDLNRGCGLSVRPVRGFAK